MTIWLKRVEVKMPPKTTKASGHRILLPGLFVASTKGIGEIPALLLALSLQGEFFK